MGSEMCIRDRADACWSIVSSIEKFFRFAARDHVFKPSICLPVRALAIPVNALVGPKNGQEDCEVKDGLPIRKRAVHGSGSKRSQLKSRRKNGATKNDPDQVQAKQIVLSLGVLVLG